MNCRICNIAAPQYELFDGLCGKCLLREFTRLREQVRPLAEFALDLSTNYDHREDAHRHGTPCFVCEAQKLCESARSLGKREMERIRNQRREERRKKFKRVRTKYTPPQSPYKNQDRVCGRY